MTYGPSEQSMGFHWRQDVVVVRVVVQGCIVVDREVAGPTDPVVAHNCRIGKRSTGAYCRRSNSHVGNEQFDLRVLVSKSA